MSDSLMILKKSLLYVSGTRDILYRPGSFAALAGSLLPGKMPVPSGPWFSYPARFFQPDRFRMKFSHLSGELWLGSRETPCLTLLGQAEELFLATEKILCYAADSRKDAFMLRLVPGSMRRALCISRCLCEKDSPVCLATAGEPVEIRLEQGEELSVNIDSLIGWQGCSKPKSFCPKLRLRDLILPRIPQNLVFTFQGPGKIWIESSARPENRKRKTIQTY